MIEIPLTQGKVALIDDEDANLAQFRWRALRDKRTWYAVRWDSTLGRRNRRIVKLHREVAKAPPDALVDHVNGDGLDCRRANLRIATAAENARNRAPGANASFKGITWHASDRKWAARITANGREVSLGRFATAKDAARAYDEAAVRLHGHFARLNFPRPEAA